MPPLSISQIAVVSALGPGTEAVSTALRNGRSGLRRNEFEPAPLDTWIGRVDGLETAPIKGSLAKFDCRNNRLAQLGLSQDGFEAALRRAGTRYGADRVGVFVGTSTSGCLETELAYRNRDPVSGALPSRLDYRHTHNLFSTAEFTRQMLGLRGPALTVSTACSSSAKAMTTAARHIAAGLCDAAVVGGVDSLCLTTLYGFASLELISTSPCRPFDAARSGISIGEAAGFALLERAQSNAAQIELAGYGESSDAYHMTSPHPEGAGALAAMRTALDNAGLDRTQVDYINAHGTGTRANDHAEDRAIHQLFGANTAVSSTKGWTGHTLGAAGIVEAIIACLCIRDGILPGTLNIETVDPELLSHIARDTLQRPLSCVLSNSFGFGGNNCSLVLRKAG